MWVLCGKRVGKLATILINISNVLKCKHDKGKEIRINFGHFHSLWLCFNAYFNAYFNVYFNAYFNAWLMLWTLF